MARRRRSPNQRYHDRVAGRYEQIYDDAYWLWHDAITWNYLKKHLPSDLRSPTIDLGCGSGKWGRKLLKSGYHVTFVDLSHKMVDEAHKQVLLNEGDARAEFQQADLMDLSGFESNHFGLATAMGEPVGNAANQHKALKEIARILQSDAILVATFDNRVACVDHYLEKGDITRLEEFLRTGKTQWLTRDPSERFEMHTSEPGQLHKMLIRAGFEVLEMLGKTVLPMRQHRHLLEDPADRRRWAKIEQELAADPYNFGRCAHIQVAARKSS
jgi:ubiquinone/menaquinone biosynthesis C-methylase UbiE